MRRDKVPNLSDLETGHIGRRDHRCAFAANALGYMLIDAHLPRNNILERLHLRNVGATKHSKIRFSRDSARLFCDHTGAQDFKPKDFERTLRGLLDEWEGKYVKPLRVSGIGTTKEAYEQQKRGDGGGGGGGGWRRGGGDGNGSRSLGE